MNWGHIHSTVCPSLSLFRYGVAWDMVPSYGSQRLRGAWTKKKENLIRSTHRIGLKAWFILTFMCPHECRRSWRPEENVRSPGAGCRLLWTAWCGCWKPHLSHQLVHSALSPWAIAPEPQQLPLVSLSITGWCGAYWLGALITWECLNGLRRKT